jgi:hypothetical protein
MVRERVGGHKFIASHGRFQIFKARAKLRNIKVTGKAASADTVAATEFPKTLTEIIKNEDYVPQQIFNVDETELFWKKMSDRSYIEQNEKKKLCQDLRYQRTG